MIKSEKWKTVLWYCIPGCCAGLEGRSLSRAFALVGKYLSYHAAEGIGFKDFVECEKGWRGDRALRRLLDFEGSRCRFKIWDEEGDTYVRKVHLKKAHKSGDTTELKVRVGENGEREPLDSGLMDGLRWVDSSLRLLSLPEGWSPELEGLSLYDTCGLQQCAVRFMRGRFNTHVGKNVDRCYHVMVNGGSRYLRDQVLMDGEAVCILDVQSAHPFLLKAFMHPDEKGDYTAALEMSGGIYSWLSEAAGVCRKEVKRDFQRFLGQNPNTAVGRRLTERFPLSSAIIQSSEDTLQRRLQNLEADAMLRGVSYMGRKIGSPIVVIHDGVICKLSDREAVRSLMLDAFQARGVEIVV